ncbi:Afadin and alpha-actinin-binding-domain-containing protein [Cerioporus squamosus]|nr:Afadin and alpha-actinin-binding-domain-containing protein [Cerioporus squamosus]
MAVATPKKLVQWALNASLSDLGSPFSEAGSSESCTSTSSLQYINSQLIAHGFVHDSGLSLEGLAKADADRVVKCLLGMLSQRIDDMSRTEDLSTKLRTLSYDHERLTSMYKTETKKAANAEREMNLHKTRMSAATKSLQISENAHKHTTAELQRTRSTLHALRATHQTEIKKIEKEKERMVERWSKLSDAQLKIGFQRAGLTCANLDVVEASDVQLRGKGQSFLDIALDQAETARKELFEQNRKLRNILLSAANELQSVLHGMRSAGDSDAQEEPSPLTLSTLFPGSPVESASETFNSLFTSLRATVSHRSEPPPTPCSCTHRASSSTSAGKDSLQQSADIERLQAVIDKLRAELEQSQKQAAAAATQTQELFDRFAEEQRLASKDISEMSVDLMTVPARDEEQKRLDERFKELEDERRKFTEAAVRLGREKAALEAERLKLLEEKRTWEVEQMLAELPPTPAAAGSSLLKAPAISPAMISKAPPRSSPRKHRAKAAGARKTRVSRRSSGVALTPRTKSKVLPAYETEVIPSSIPAIPPSPSRPLPDLKTSIAAPSPPPSPHLTSAFVLPPPSPAAAFDDMRTHLPPLPPMPKFEMPPPSEEVSDDSMDATPEPLPSSSSTSSSSGPAVPSTPVARPFPMAKPFAQRMIHAYSPVKPSPLSRILMMANSPESPEGPQLDALAEVDESAMDAAPVRSLAEELGVSEDDDSPLREKQPQPQPQVQVQSKPATAAAARKATAGTQVKDKGKAKAAPAPAPQSASRARTRAGGALEKENVKRAKLSAPSSSGLGVGSGSSSTGSTKSTGSGSSASGSRDAKKAAPGKPLGIGARARAGAGAGAGTTGPSGKPGAKPSMRGGGPRRVPIGSADAASVPTWRG